MIKKREARHVAVIGGVNQGFRLREAAERIGCSLPTLERRIADGTIRAIKLGRCRIVPASEINRVLQNGAA